MIRYLRRIIKPLRLTFLCIKGNIKTEKWEKSKNKKCWIIGTPDHKNLGDHAIAYSTKVFVEKNLMSYDVEEITEGDFYNSFIRFKKSLKKEDIIILQGGGNLGNLYQYIEDIRRTLIKKCKKNPIIMFPQSMFFTKDNMGLFEKNITRKIYGRNKNIYYFAREEYTCKDMKDIFDNSKVYCVPDIVLYLNDILKDESTKREGILCCLRSDKESAITKEQRTQIVKTLKSVKNVENIDTVCDYMISQEKREEELFKIWKRFASAELIVTDRLHGMIFALITNTPCVVFSNNNKKLSGVYKWVENFKTVKFFEDVTQFNDAVILQMTDMIAGTKNSWSGFEENYSCLKKVLQEVSYNGKN